MRLKRVAAPKTWKIERKIFTWITHPNPGPHPKDFSLPLLIIVRDILGYAQTAREAKKIIKDGKILVDMKPRKDYKFPVGFMDTIYIPETKEAYRMLLNNKGELTLYKIDEKEANKKLCRIENKTTVKGGKTQLNLHDGRNILVDDPKKYKTGEVVLIELPSQKILKKLEFKEGNLVFLIGGAHAGAIARISGFHPFEGPQPDKVELTSLDGKIFETLEEYAFVIGEKEPELKWGEIIE